MFNVQDYGATPNDATDDRTAIQNAFNALNAAGGGTVYFPTGVYLVSGDISVTTVATVEGNNAGTSVIQTTTSNVTSNIFTVVLPNATNGNWQPMVFRDLRLEAPLAAHTSGVAIYFRADPKWSNGFKLDNVRFGYGMTHAVRIDTAAAFVIDKCFFQGSTQNDVRIDNVVDADVNDGVISNSYFYQNAAAPYAAILHVGGGGLKIVNNKFIGYEHHYVNYMSLGLGEHTTGILHFKNNSSEQAATSNILFSGTKTHDVVLIQGNDFSVGRRSDFACLRQLPASESRPPLEQVTA